MNEPTKQQLNDKLAEVDAERRQYLDRLNSMDPEARAYSSCVEALSSLTKTDNYQLRSGKSPDTEAIRRVVDGLSKRFGLDQLDTQPSSEFYDFSPELESQDDPRDTVISQLIDALRKS